jgi:hypothetical protein
MVYVSLLVERGERQRPERRQVRKRFAQHPRPSDVIITVVVQDRRPGEFNPAHHCRNQHKPGDDLNRLAQSNTFDNVTEMRRRGECLNLRRSYGSNFLNCRVCFFLPHMCSLPLLDARGDLLNAVAERFKLIEYLLRLLAAQNAQFVRKSGDALLEGLDIAAGLALIEEAVEG